ncbi:MAG: ATP-dependent helicase HrpB [Planctomycetota bacterium]
MLALPIDTCLPQITATLAKTRRLVLTAAPGAGKSTRVPPALAAAVPGEVLVLQPRRVAARSLAARIAAEQGWQLGAEIGYRVRHERVGDNQTQLWLQTEGTLTRRLLDDPYLDGVSCVVLDEFHERSWHSDVALAWIAELQRSLRDDLHLVVMSATMDAAAVAAHLDDAPVIAVPGAPHPVTTCQRPAQGRERIAEHTARVVREALAEGEDDILAFLPGAGEINACAGLLADVAAEIVPLHGSLPPAEQDRALQPGTSRRVVLATNLAETSLTVPGVRSVVDSGYQRQPHFDADNGLDELRLERISRFSADQRRGRAGRLGPGRCYRLWSAADDGRLKDAPLPELRRCDLAAPILALKRLHGSDLATFPWFEAPAGDDLAATEALLADLGLLEGVGGAITGRGRLVADLPAHPRLGCLLLVAASYQALELGARMAALCEGRDVLTREHRAGPAGADLLLRLDALARAHGDGFAPRLRAAGIDVQAARRCWQDRGQLRRAAERVLSAAGDGCDQAAELVPRLLLAAWPDRVARRGAPGGNSAKLCGGAGIQIERGSALFAGPGDRRAALLVAHSVQGLAGHGAKRRILRLGAELDEEVVEDVWPGSVVRHVQLRYDDARDRVISAAVWRYRDLDLRYQEGAAVADEQIETCLAEALVERAERVLADHPLADWLARLAWLRTVAPDQEWPQIDAEQVLRLACVGCRSRAEVTARDLVALAEGLCDYQVAQRIAAWAPERYALPTGNRVRLDYSGPQPVLAARVQELFGFDAHPRVCAGREPVLLHLLAPNFRPVQITEDLPGFWRRTYPQVRKDLRGRYPKHPWPEDPLTAEPVAKGSRQR